MIRLVPTPAPNGRRLTKQRTDFTSSGLAPSSKATTSASSLARKPRKAVSRAPAIVPDAQVRPVGIDADAAPLGRPALAGLSWDVAIGDWDTLLSDVVARDVAIGDWDDLLSAVKARLKLTVGEGLPATSERDVHDAHWFQASVLECVAALDQLHTTLTHELDRCRQLKVEVAEAETALAQARAELAGTRAGERRARHLAMHDGLTSLPNRRFFGEQLDHALAQVAPRRPAIAVLYLDLDGFKPINDAHGHATGDELLKIVAARLARAVRAGDMVGRLGGDEFACLLADSLNREQLTQLASKLVDAVSAPLQVGPLKLTVRPSIGIAICPTDGITAEALLKSADTAMYRAKRHQCGYAFFDQLALAGEAGA
jgi:diguanylate cyclase